MKDYTIYQEIIKPIEKKYNKLLLLYSFFKCKFLKEKLDYYNKLLNAYYNSILKNDNYQELIKHFK